MKKEQKCDYEGALRKEDEAKIGYCGIGKLKDAKQRYVRCPKCNRRLIARMVEHDNEMFYSVPPHKKKGWWKKPKKGNRS